jgi:hypothetical protein
MQENSSWKTKVFVIGGLAGLITGLAAAFLFIRTHQDTEDDHTITSGQGVKIGMGVASLLKMIAEGGPK